MHPTGTPASHVSRDRVADVVGQRQTALAPGLGRPYKQMTVTPANVIKCESRHFPGTQSQAHEQQQDRPVTLSDGSRFIAAAKNTPDLVCRQVAGQRGVYPAPDRRHGPVEPRLHGAIDCEETQQRSHRSHGQ